MKRDDVDLSAAAVTARTPLWFGGGRLFGWLHAPAAGAGDTVAVLCAPMGHEYTRAHRTLRHLAERLARAGIPALRFDYDGTGDSAGSDLDPGRLAAWRGSIRSAIDEARRLTGCERVCLAGVRLGATLAAQVAAEVEVDTLVLWNPVVKGRAYVRELQAIAQMAARVSDELEGGIEAAGFTTTAETLAGLREIDLNKVSPRAGRLLLVARDDAAPEQLALAITHTLRLPGWAGMMAEHQFTVVPDAALDAIVGWTEKAREKNQNQGQTTFSEPKTWSVPGLCCFGKQQNLFGVLEGADAPRERPAILLFNAGSVHHVGPNRIYVELARRFAALGFASLRFDLQGIGDSPLGVEGRENHPYPPHAQADVRAALEHLRSEHGFRRFIAMGLCSGAHTAFHAGLEDIEGLEEVVLINPLTFQYVEGMSLETVTQFADAQQYRKSMKDPGRWLKLLRGDVNFRRLFEVALAHPKTLARSYYHAFCERLLPSRAPKLSRDLRGLFQLERRVTMFIAEGDPGREILMAGARHTASRALSDGRLRLETIPGGDHTFSQSKPRRDLTERLSAHLRQVAGGRTAR